MGLFININYKKDEVNIIVKSNRNVQIQLVGLQGQSNPTNSVIYGRGDY